MGWRAAILVALLSVAAHTVDSANPVEDTIEARRGYKQLVQHFSRELFAMARGDIPYDAEKAALFANNLKTLTRLKNASLWPAGSDRAGNRGKTRALAEVWRTDAIDAHHAALRSGTGALAKVAGNGVDALNAEIGKLERICRDCHESFRADDF